MRPALKIPGVRRLLTAYGVNQLGDWAAEIALAVAVLHATGSAVAVAAVWVVHRALTGVFAPTLASRLERHAAALPLLYVGQAAAFTALAIVATAGRAELAIVLPLVALDGALAPTARALARAQLLERSQPAGLHREVNAAVNVVFTVNAVAAPAVGGLLVAVAGPGPALWVNVATFLIAAIAVPRARAHSDERPPSLREVWRGLASSGPVATLLTTNAVLMAFQVMILPVEIAYITQTLGASVSAAGLVLTAWGAGMILGGVIAARRSGGSIGPLLAVASVAEGIALLGMGTSPSVTFVMVWAVVGGIGNGLYGMAFVTLVQEHTPDRLQAIVGGLEEATVGIAMGAGFALGGLVAGLASPRTAYLVAGVGSLAVVAIAAARFSTSTASDRPAAPRSRARRLRRGPAAPAAHQAAPAARPA